MNKYIVRKCDGKLCAFYYNEEGIIYIRQCDNKKWGKVKSVIENVRKNYTVNISDKGELIVLCQGFNGDVYMCTDKKEGFENKVILKNNANKSPDITFNAVIKDKCMRLFYNLPIENESSQYIATQEVKGDAKWSMAENIDKFKDFEYDMFQIYNFNSEPIVVYQRCEPEIQLGYRRILAGRIGEFKKVFSTGYKIKCHSFICCEGDLHFAVIVQNRFVSKLVYINVKDNGTITKATIWEGCGMQECLLQFIENKLYLQWKMNKQIYYTVKKSDGAGFTMVEKYHGTLVENITKARYIACVGIDELECAEVFVDENKPYDIQGIKPFMDRIYQSEYIAQNSEDENEYEVEIANLKRSVDILKNKLNVAQGIIEEKELKVMNLVEALKHKNEEMLKNERTLRAKYKNLLASIEEGEHAHESESN